MELEDCAYPLITKIEYGADPKVIFKDADLVICLGGFPRKVGMERKELLLKNMNIFKE
jgi:malate/lactate dehydrogenase